MILFFMNFEKITDSKFNVFADSEIVYSYVVHGGHKGKTILLIFS